MPPGVSPLYLRDEELKQGVDLLFFAMQNVWAQGTPQPNDAALGRAHGRALHFIARQSGPIGCGFVGSFEDYEAKPQPRAQRSAERRLCGTAGRSPSDRRMRQLRLTHKGEVLENAHLGSPAARIGAGISRSRPRSCYRISPRADGPDVRRTPQEDDAMNAQNDDAHILVVDDDERLRALLQRYLVAERLSRECGGGCRGSARADEEHGVRSSDPRCDDARRIRPRFHASTCARIRTCRS